MFHAIIYINYVQFERDYRRLLLLWAVIILKWTKLKKERTKERRENNLWLLFSQPRVIYNVCTFFFSPSFFSLVHLIRTKTKYNLSWTWKCFEFKWNWRPPMAKNRVTNGKKSFQFFTGDNNLYYTMLFSFAKLHSTLCLCCLFIYLPGGSRDE